MFTRKAMNARSFADLLSLLALVVLIGGWVLAIVLSSSSAQRRVQRWKCQSPASSRPRQDTTPSAVILLTVIGFGATVGSLFIWALRYILVALNQIEENTRSER